MKEDTASGRETEQLVRSLPVDLWPIADREAWAEACRPSVRLKRGGAASHMRSVTHAILAKRCGYFFDFLSRSGRLEMSATAGAQVTPDNVEAYVAELKSRVSSVTVYGGVQKLRRFIQLVAPDRDLDWLIEIERQLFSEMRPRSKWDRVVFANILVDAGLTLMADAEMAKQPKLTCARMFRNGLMIPLLAYCPVRLKNYAALEIGRSFVNVDGIWWIVLTAAETKEKRPDERPVPEELTDPIKRYLEIYRPILTRGNTLSNGLWMKSFPQLMRYSWACRPLKQPK
jgi:integrase